MRKSGVEELFLHSLLLKRFSLPSRIRTIYILLPMIVYILVVFGFSYLLISNDYFIEQMLLKIEEKALLEKDSEVLEMLDMTRVILTDPGYHILISIKNSFDHLINLFLYLFLSYLSISFITEKWELIKPFSLVASASINILSIGFIINTILKLVLLDGKAIVGITLFSGDFPTKSIFYSLINELDFFMLWFIVALSFGVSYLYDEKKYFVVLLFSMIWLLLFTLSFLVNFQLIFGFFYIGFQFSFSH